MTLLLALVLGTLVGNTYAFCAMQKSELETMASRAMLVDQALAQYGPEAQPMRDLMKTALTQSYDLFWRGADADPAQLRADVALKRWGAAASALETLDPKTPAEKDALADEQYCWHSVTWQSSAATWGRRTPARRAGARRR